MIHMFPHHDSRYNLEMIIENLVLLQDHYSGNRCGDCILKHLQTIAAYADEGMTLDNSKEFVQYLEAAHDVAEKHKALIIPCVNEEGACEIVSHDQINGMITEIRMLRKEINMALYHMAGDLLYEGEGNSHDITQHHHSHIGGHDHGHEHEHEHEEPVV